VLCTYVHRALRILLLFDGVYACQDRIIQFFPKEYDFQLSYIHIKIEFKLLKSYDISWKFYVRR